MESRIDKYKDLLNLIKNETVLYSHEAHGYILFTSIDKEKLESIRDVLNDFYIGIVNVYDAVCELERLKKNELQNG